MGSFCNKVTRRSGLSVRVGRSHCFSLQNGGFSRPRKGQKNDKAHPPVHPTAYANNLTGDDKRVYEFITRRFLACCSTDAEGFQTTVEVVAGGENFSATGKRQSTCLPARLTSTTSGRACFFQTLKKANSSCPLCASCGTEQQLLQVTVPN